MTRDADEFPDDAPTDLGDLVAPSYERHEYHRLHRDVSGDPRGGATWRSETEEVVVHNYAPAGYWGVIASAIERDDDGLLIRDGSNGSCKGLSREAAFQLADRYMRGDESLPTPEERERPATDRQLTLDDVGSEGRADP